MINARIADSMWPHVYYQLQDERVWCINSYRYWSTLIPAASLPLHCQFDHVQAIEDRMLFLYARMLKYVNWLAPDTIYQHVFSKVIFSESFSYLLPKEITNRKDKVEF
jgi:hypothetical protein